MKKEQKDLSFFYFIINYTYYFNFLFISSTFFLLLNNCKSNPIFQYCQSITLLNGNILIIHKNGIDIYDSQLIELKSNILQINDFIKNDTQLSKIIISRFSEKEYGYIIATINDNIYIFNWNGTLQYNNRLEETELKGDYYTIIPLMKEGYNYTYMIGFINNNKINCFFFNYDSLNYINNKIKNHTYNYQYSLKGQNYFINDEKGLSCQLMRNSSEKDIIVCFIYLNKDKKLTHFYIDINNYNMIIPEDFKYINISFNAIKVIKSAITKDKKKSFVCLLGNEGLANCIIYDIINNHYIYNFQTENNQCKNQIYALNLYYMRETEQFFFLCSNNDKNVTLSTYDKNLNQLNTTKIEFGTNINGISIIYSKVKQKYFIISDSNYNNGKNTTFFEMNSEKINLTNPFFEDIISFIESLKSTILSTILTSDNNSIICTTILTSKFIITTQLDTTYPITYSTIITTILYSTLLISTQLDTTYPNDFSSYPSNSILNTDFPTAPLNSSTYIISSSELTIPISHFNSTYFIPSSLESISSINVIHEEIIHIPKENITKELPSLIDNVEIGQIYKKKGEDYSILIYPTNSTQLTTLTQVNFTECEAILRKHYNIPESSIMTFLQIELENYNSKSLINQVEYKAFDSNKTFLNLSLCENVNIQVIYSIKNKLLTDLDKDKAIYYKKSNIDIFNINDSFFNDICEPYSELELDNDLILEDRIKDIYLNYSLCEDGCSYIKIDLNNLTITCECKVKENISTIIKPIHLEHSEGSSTNFEIIKCSNLVFSLKEKLKNIGFWIFSILIFVHAPILLYYFAKGVRPVKEYIYNEMEKYGYIKIQNSVKKIIRKKKIKNKTNNNLIYQKNNKKSKAVPPKKNITKINNNNSHIKNKNKNNKKKYLLIKNVKII